MLQKTEIDNLSRKKNNELRPHEKFVLQVSGEYGCKDYYTFKELETYNSGDNLVASDNFISDDGHDY